MTPQELTTVEVVLGEPVLAWRTLAGGFSHETCVLDLDGGRAVVRLGGASPAIEAAVMAWARAYVPVPRVRAVRETGGEAVRSFMVIEYVDGTPLSEVLSDDGRSTVGLAALGVEIAGAARRIGAVEAAAAPGFFADPTLGVRPEPPWSQQLPGYVLESMGSTPPERLDPGRQRAWAALCAEHAPALDDVQRYARLVHSDFNPKNILVSPSDDGWRVDAVLDWEFSYAGCPFADAANMLRHAADYPQVYVEGFRAGYDEYGGASVAADWEYLGAVLDMFALTGLVTRPLGHGPADLAASRIRQLLAEGLPATRH